jgi:hypothetical protein
MLQPALLGGLLIGVLSALPIVNLANCCCLWIVFGGALSAYLLQQDRPTPISSGDGALVGLMAGVVGAFAWLVVSVPIQLVVGPIQGRLMERALENAGDLPPDAREWMDSLAPGAVGLVTTVISFAVMLFSGVVFATLGGVLGAVVVRKPDAQEPPPLAAAASTDRAGTPPPPPPLPPDGAA